MTNHLAYFRLILVLVVSSYGSYAQEESTNEIKKNSIRLDFHQRSFGLGLTYDRVLYSKNFDWHITAGFFPPSFTGIGGPLQYSYNFSSYITFTENKARPFGGIGYNKEHTNDYFRGSEHFNNIIAIIGLDYPLNNRWSVQFMYTPYYNITIGNGRTGFNSQTGYNDDERVEPSRSTRFSFLYGGANVGYKF